MKLWLYRWGRLTGLVVLAAVFATLLLLQGCSPWTMRPDAFGGYRVSYPNEPMLIGETATAVPVTSNIMRINGGRDLDIAVGNDLCIFFYRDMNIGKTAYLCPRGYPVGRLGLEDRMFGYGATEAAVGIMETFGINE